MYVRVRFGTVAASVRLAGEGKRQKRAEKRPTSEEPLVMIRPLTLTPWPDGELVAVRADGVL